MGGGRGREGKVRQDGMGRIGRIGIEGWVWKRLCNRAFSAGTTNALGYIIGLLVTKLSVTTIMKWFF